MFVADNFTEFDEQVSKFRVAIDIYVITVNCITVALWKFSSVEDFLYLLRNQPGYHKVKYTKKTVAVGFDSLPNYLFIHWSYLFASFK